MFVIYETKIIRKFTDYNTRQMKENIDINYLMDLLDYYGIQSDLSNSTIENLYGLVEKYNNSDSEISEIVSKINVLDILECLE
jgi:hypothetical protein